jgi:hypothetical protein
MTRGVAPPRTVEPRPAVGAIGLAVNVRLSEILLNVRFQFGRLGAFGNIAHVPERFADESVARECVPVRSDREIFVPRTAPAESADYARAACQVYIKVEEVDSLVI